MPNRPLNERLPRQLARPQARQPSRQRGFVRCGAPGVRVKERPGASQRALRLTFLLLAGVLAWGCLSAANYPAQSEERSESPDALRRFSRSVEDLVQRVSPSVVQVQATGFGPTEGAENGEAAVVISRFRSLGSGVIVDPDGYILTNSHVLRGAQRVQVILPATQPVPSSNLSNLTPRGRTLEARVVGLSREIDLALLHIEAKGLPALPLSDYGALRQGEMVLAFGSPGGLQNSVTMGIVSAVARQPDPDNPMVYIQTDAPINPGNSGGPLVDVEGKLVGINTYILTRSGGNEGLGFAIPSGIVAVAYPQLRQFGHLHRGQIGIEVQTITPVIAAGLGLTVDQGVIISDVLPGSPADKAGLKIQERHLERRGPADHQSPGFWPAHVYAARRTGSERPSLARHGKNAPRGHRYSTPAQCGSAGRSGRSGEEPG